MSTYNFIVSSRLLYSSLVLILGFISLIHRASKVIRQTKLLLVDCKTETFSLSLIYMDTPQSLVCFPTGCDGFRWSRRRVSKCRSSPFDRHSTPHSVNIPTYTQCDFSGQSQRALSVGATQSLTFGWSKQSHKGL